MKIAAGLIIRNEADRYLGLGLENLAEFVDEVCIYDDGSGDSWRDLVPSGLAIRTFSILPEARDKESAFHRHAIGRNKLLSLTLSGSPDWVIASDADELFTDGPALRRAIETTRADALLVDIAEGWEVCDDVICTREDGGWRTHPIAAVWRASRFGRLALSLTDKQTATGRVPDAVHRVRSEPSGVALVHLGWACEAERAERFKRYPSGSGHANQHVESIMWRDARVKLAAREWPESWSEDFRERVQARANRS